MACLYSEFAFAYASGGERAFSERMTDFVAGRASELGVAGGRVLDVACGVGAACEAFARRGFRASGVDQSEEMLSIARDSARRRGLDIEYARRDMRDLGGLGTFDLVTCMYDSLNFMATADDLAMAFRAVHGALVPAGIYVFDMYSIRGLTTSWGSRDEIHTATENHFVATRTVWNYETLSDTKRFWGFTRDGNVWRHWTEEHTAFGYPLTVVQQLLHASGFSILDQTGWDGGNEVPFSDAVLRVIFTARKRS